MEIEELFKRHQSVATAGFTKDSYKPGLDAIRRLDRILGSPSGDFRSIHVAGTNGKGSVCSMLAAALAATGLKVGLYTSPHILDFRERMKIVSDGGYTMIPPGEVQDFLDRWEDDIEGMTLFEVTTAMAFQWFSKQKVDIAVIEVGLGGRLDSTNIITPELSVITGIGLDHCEILGDTRQKIAAEKAGIFKKGVPALVWGRDAETDPVFERIASEKGCRLHYADSIPFEPDAVIGALDLKSPCQKENLRTVLCALDILGIKADMDALARTAAITGLHGRWEKTEARTPNGKKAECILDIGHNPAALSSNFTSVGDKPVIVYGVMADKDYRTNISLIPEDAEVFLCSPATPRALPVRNLAAAFREVSPGIAIHPTGSVREAIDKAFSFAAGKKTVLIVGSTYVVSEAAAYLKLFSETKGPFVPAPGEVLKRELEAYPEGIILPVDKPYRWTSADVIRKIKWTAGRYFGKKNIKVGHAGTLDPLATGMLLVCIGKATKLAEELQSHEKEYIAGVSFGATTPSYDREKDIDRICPLDGVNEGSIRGILPRFIGTQMQVAPLFSAKSVDGVRAYETARKLYKEGRFEDAGDILNASEISISGLELLSCSRQKPERPQQVYSHGESEYKQQVYSLGELEYKQRVYSPQGGIPPLLNPPEENIHAAGKLYDKEERNSRINVADISGAELIQAEIKVNCSKGTYIRALARDLGEALGSGAFLHSLRRTKVGSFNIENSLTVDDVLKILGQQ